MANGNGGNSRTLIAIVSVLTGAVIGGGGSWLVVGTRLATLQTKAVSTEKTLDKLERALDKVSERLREHERFHFNSGGSSGAGGD